MYGRAHGSRIAPDCHWYPPRDVLHVAVSLSPRLQDLRSRPRVLRSPSVLLRVEILGFRAVRTVPDCMPFLSLISCDSRLSTVPVLVRRCAHDWKDSGLEPSHELGTSVRRPSTTASPGTSAGGCFDTLTFDWLAGLFDLRRSVVCSTLNTFALDSAASSSLSSSLVSSSAGMSSYLSALLAVPLALSRCPPRSDAAGDFCDRPPRSNEVGEFCDPPRSDTAG